MPWCPNCKKDDQSTRSHCMECGTSLLEERPNYDSKIDSETTCEPCLLAANLTQMDATMITALLEDANIPSFIKDRGIGGYMKLYMGYTVFGIDIYVGQNSYDKAKEFMDFYYNTNAEVLEQEEDYNLEETENDEISEEKKTNARFNKNTIAAIIIILSMISVLVVMFFKKISELGLLNK